VAGVAGLIVAVPMAGFIKNTVDTLETSRNKSMEIEREIESVSSIEPVEQ
jgi:predicted PurR-regulated permease PerM